MSATAELLAQTAAELLFQQVPLLRIDGMKLVQSGAIARYLARKARLYGETDMDAAKYVSLSAFFHTIDIR